MVASWSGFHWFADYLFTDSLTINRNGLQQATTNHIGPVLIISLRQLLRVDLKGIRRANYPQLTRGRNSSRRSWWVGFKVGMDVFNDSCLFSWSPTPDTCTCRLMDRQLIGFGCPFHIFAVVAVVGILETVDRCWIYHFRRKTIPSIDHSLTEEEFPCI